MAKQASRINAKHREAAPKLLEKLAADKVRDEILKSANSNIQWSIRVYIKVVHYFSCKVWMNDESDRINEAIRSVLPSNEVFTLKLLSACYVNSSVSSLEYKLGNSIKGVRIFISALRLISTFYLAIFVCTFSSGTKSGSVVIHWKKKS
jgi:hypothetical protein